MSLSTWITCWAEPGSPSAGREGRHGLAEPPAPLWPQEEKLEVCISQLSPQVHCTTAGWGHDGQSHCTAGELMFGSKVTHRKGQG